MIADNGVVVNDSLVLLDYIRQHDGDDRPVEILITACPPHSAGLSDQLYRFFTDFTLKVKNQAGQGCCRRAYTEAFTASCPASDHADNANFHRPRRCSGFMSVTGNQPAGTILIPMTLSLSAGLLIGMTASLILTQTCYAILGNRRAQIPVHS